ncbi:hypothetical protein NEFER03_0163 [Nematocida sp. LUAm3]|nr:hypothetical protein NEFER03_0163 [Nematocida sp. LUAm3]KAI5173616.1 hypothetical protein NEFER02_0132 [Nematocida sp. LUAm2]KAI5176837.1 hypothetical protein NEFER01_0162 [Nematocida sp. LUAm1]
MNMKIKRSISREKLMKVEENWGKPKEEEHKDVSIDISTGTEEEVEMILSLLREIDKTEKKEISREIIGDALEKMKEIPHGVYQMIKEYVYGLHVAECEEECPEGYSCYFLLSMGLHRLESDSNMFYREARGYIHSQTLLSFKVLQSAILSGCMGIRRFSYIFYQYSTVQRIESLETIGVLFHFLLESEILGLLEASYKKEDSVFLLRCAGCLVYAAHYEGKSEKITNTLNWLLKKDIHLAIKKISRSKWMHQVMYILAQGMLHLFGIVYGGHEVFFSEISYFCSMYSSHKHVYLSLLGLIRMNGVFERKKEAICHLSIDICLKEKNLCKESFSLLNAAIDGLHAMGIRIEKYKVDVILDIFQNKKNIFPITETIKRLEEKEKSREECAVFLLKKLAQEEENEKEKKWKCFVSLDSSYLSKWEWQLAQTCITNLCKKLPHYLLHRHLVPQIGRYSKNTCEEIVKIMMERGRKENSFFGVVLEIAKRVSVSSIPQGLLEPLKDAPKYGFELLRMFSIEELPDKWIEDSFYKIFSERHREQGILEIFYANIIFPEKIEKRHKEIKEKIEEWIVQRKEMDYTYAFRFLKKIEEKKKKIDTIFYRNIFTNQTAFFLYQKAYGSSVPSFLCLLRVFVEKGAPLLCRDCLLLIKKESTAHKVIRETEEILWMRKENKQERRKVRGKEISFLLETIQAHNSPHILLLSLAQGISSLTELQKRTKKVCFYFILERLQEEENEEILSLLLSICPREYMSLLKSINSCKVSLSNQYIFLIGKVLKEIKAINEVSDILDKLETIFEAKKEIAESVYSLYLKMKILQCRRFSCFSRETASSILRKIEKCPLIPSIFPLVIELFTTTHIDVQMVLREVEERAEKKRNGDMLHIKSSLQTFLSKGGPLEIIGYRVYSSQEILPITEALLEFTQNASFSVPTERISKSQSHCRYIQEHAESPEYTRNLMLFFIRESSSSLIRAFEKPCESSNSFLSGIFPLSFFKGIEGLSYHLKRSFIDGVGKAARKHDISLFARAPLIEALEYALIHTKEEHEAEYISKYIERSKSFKYKKHNTPQEEMVYLFSFFHSLSTDHFLSYLFTLKNQLSLHDELLQKAVDAIYSEIFRDSEQAHDLLSLLPPPYSRQDSLSLISTLKEIGNSYGLSEKVNSSHLDDLARTAEASLFSWSTPLFSYLKNIYTSKSKEESEESLDVLKRKFQIIRISLPSPLSLRIDHVCRSFKSLPEDLFKLSIRNEILSGVLKTGAPLFSSSSSSLSSFLSFSANKKASLSPFSSLFEISLHTQSIALTRGIITTEVSSKAALIEKYLAHSLFFSETKKSFEEKVERLLVSTEDKETFAGEVEMIQKRANRKWLHLFLKSTSPLKKRIELLKEAMRVHIMTYDHLLILFLISEQEILKEKDFSEGLSQIIEETDTKSWLPYLYEVLLLSETAKDSSSYILLINKIFTDYPEKISSQWAHFSVEAHAEIFQKIEKHAAYKKQTKYVNLINEISQTSNEQIFQEIKRFRETEKKEKGFLFATETPFSSQAVQEPLLASLKKRLLEISERISLLPDTYIYMEKHRSEEKIKIHIKLFQKAVEACFSTNQGVPLVLNRLDQLNSSLSLNIPSSLLLSKEAEELLKNMDIPGSQAKVLRVKTTLKIIPSLQRPRKISFLGNNGKIYHFLIKKEKEIPIERFVSHCFSVLKAFHPETYEIFSSGISVSAYIEESLSLSEAICEVREDEEVLLKKRNKAILEREKNAISKLCRNYNYLTDLEKLEIYQKITNFSGNEIKQYITKYSYSLDSFLRRKESFSRSYLYNSKAAYILGLGDRHPKNILLLFSDASAFHIDYVDALDTLQKRKYFQEKVPMRLTPMITTAIGPETEEKLIMIDKEIIALYKEYAYCIEAILSLFYLTKPHYRGISLQQAIKIIEKKIPDAENLEEEGRKLFRDSVSVEALSQMFIGWMPFW